MSTTAEILQTLQDGVNRVQAVDSKLDNITTLVQNLKDQIAAGGVATQQDLDQIMAAAQSVQTPLVEAEQKEDAILNP